MTLNLKYRPRLLDDVVGNEDVVVAVRGLLEKGSPPRAWLFSGPSGCGKTTMARVIANELGCLDNDMIEVNSSDARGIDTARDLIMRCQMTPWGPARVLILDEVHQATKDFQNAILKLVEEPPAKTYIILCTTDPGRILPTVRNRCQHFEMSPLSRTECVRLLTFVAGEEGHNLPKSVAAKIWSVVEGCPRQALILLDRVLGGDDLDSALQSFRSEESQAIDLCRAIIKGASWKKVSGIIKGIETDPESVRRIALGYFTAVLLNSGSEDAAWCIECFSAPFYDSGKAGLALACYKAVSSD